MKKVFLSLLLLFFSISAYAEESLHNAVMNDEKIIYTESDASWVKESASANGDFILKKTLVEGVGSHSIYRYNDDSLAFALATEYEFVCNGKLVIVDNNLLKYYKLIYDGEQFLQVELTEEELKEIFPEAEIFKISQIDSDNKIWLHKPFLKTKTLILVNDTEKFFHKFSTKSKNIQDPEIRGLITISKYGRIKFTHFGERNGKIIFYIR